MTCHRSSRPPLVAPLILSLGFGGAVAGSAQQLEQFSETVEVRVVNVEVMVTDSDGNPVTGLTRDDFEIYEDGRQVALTNFFAVEGRNAVPGEGEAAAELAPTPETRNLNLVVFIDNLNMRPENRNLVFEHLKGYFDQQLDPRDQVMLVTMGDVIEVAEAFTNDADRLALTLDRLATQVSQHVRLELDQRMLVRRVQQARLPGNPILGGANIDRGAFTDFDQAQQEALNLAVEIANLSHRRYNNVRASVDAMAKFTDSLAGMRGRKAVLYVSDGLPLRSADSLAQGWLNKFERWASTQDAADVERSLREMSSVAISRQYDASDLFDELVAHASNNRVAFYPISNTSRLTPRSVAAEFAAPGTADGQGPMSADVIALESQSLESSLLSMAEGTGGVAFTATSSIGGLLARVIRDFETFYSLGYSPPDGGDREAHQIEVKVKRSGLAVRHLSSYQLKDPLAELQDRTLSALHYGIVDNVFEIRLDPGREVRTGGKTYQVPVWVKIPFHNLVLLPEDGFHVAQLSLFVVARDLRGGISPFRQIQLPIRIPDADLGKAMQSAATYPIQLEMHRGWQRISVGVRDHLAQLDATLNLEIEVGAPTKP